MKDSILEKIICPQCSARDKSDHFLMTAGGKKAGDPMLFCSHCRTHFHATDGILNLAGNLSHQKLFSTQWAMEFEPLVAVYDHLWRPALTCIISDLKWEMKMSRQLMNVSSGMDVLDLACGTGNFTKLFADSAKPGEVIGVDLSLPMLKQAGQILKNRKHINVSLIRADVTRWPFAPETFDRIHCAGALHMLPDIQNVFISIYRSLRKGGYFVGVTYYHGGDFATQMVQNFAANGKWIHWFDQQELQNLSSRAGFIHWEERTYKQGVVFRIQKI